MKLIISKVDVKYVYLFTPEHPIHPTICPIRHAPPPPRHRTHNPTKLVMTFRQYFAKSTLLHHSNCITFRTDLEMAEKPGRRLSKLWSFSDWDQLLTKPLREACTLVCPSKYCRPLWATDYADGNATSICDLQEKFRPAIWEFDKMYPH